MPCDASGMAEIHRLYKSGFGEGLSLVDGVREGDAAHAAVVAEHLPDEEENIVPIMESVLTQQEVDAAGAHGRKSTPKGKTFPMLGGILAAQPDGGTEWLAKNLPAPVRLVWKVLGRRQYEAHRRALVQGPD